MISGFLSSGSIMQRRTTTTVVFAGFLLLGLLFLMWGILIPDIANALEMTQVISGAMFTLFFVGMMLGGLIGGKYVAKFDFMPLFAVLCAVNAVLIFIVSTLTYWPLLLVMVVAVGIVSACKITIGHTLIATMYVQRRFVMMGIMDFMFSLGTLLASFYVSILYSFEQNWRIPLQLLCGLFLLLAVFTYWVARQGNVAVKATEPKAPKQSLSFAVVLKQPVFIFLVLASFGYGAVEFGSANWFVSYAQQGRGFSGDESRMMLALFTLGMVISRLGFALLLRWFSTHRLMVTLATMTMVGALVVKLSASAVLISSGNFLLGLGLGGLFPLVLSAAMNIDSSKGPLLSGMSMFGNAFGVQLASFSTGLWAQQAGLVAAYWIIPISGIILWISAWYYSRHIKIIEAQALTGSQNSATKPPVA